MPTAVTFITTNANKLMELSLLLPSAELSSLSLDLPEQQGTSLEIVHAKLLSAAASRPCESICVEDTSLSFDALSANGVFLPGPYIKQFLQSLGQSGLSRLLSPYTNKLALATTLIAYTNGTTSLDLITALNPLGIHCEMFIGETTGTIVEQPRGCSGFGWYASTVINRDRLTIRDSVFEPVGGSLTYGEMSKVEKSVVSHRGKAAAKFDAFLARIE